MSRGARRDRCSKTRAIGYAFSGEFDKSAIERVLAAAERRGAVTQFDSDSGHFVWFNGPPGAALRAVRDRVRAMIKDPRSVNKTSGYL